MSKLSVTAFGEQILVETVGEFSKNHFESIATAWHRCTRTPSTGLRLTVGLTSDDQAGVAPDITGQTIDEVFENLTQIVTLKAIELASGKGFMFHAAGLVLQDKKTVVALVGRSGAGKTTATRILGTKHGYVTDETLFVDLDRRVRPYPKPLSVKVPEKRWKQQIGPDDLGLIEANEDGLSLGKILMISRKPDLETAIVAPLPMSEALRTVPPQMSSLGLLPSPLQALCSLIDETGGLLEVSYSDASQLHDVFESFQTISSDTPSNWRPANASIIQRAAHPGTIRRADVNDAVIVDENLFIHREHEIVELNAVGLQLWELCDQPKSRERLTQEFFAFPQQINLRINELLDAGILIEEPALEAKTGTDQVD